MKRKEREREKEKERRKERERKEEYVLLKKISLIPLFDIIWWFSLLAFIALTYFNFIVFTFKIKNKARAFKKEVEKAKCGLITKCKEAEVKVEELRGLSRINARLKSD